MTTRADDLREQALEVYDVLGAPPRSDLLALTELAARLAGVPMATLNLITATEQWQVASFGFDGSVCSREDSMCRIPLEDERPVVLSDAGRDPRYAGNPFTTGELGSVRFYGSHPLVTPSGIVLGTLCVFDSVPHEVDPDLEHFLASLAARVVDVLELGVASRQLEVADERLAAFAGQVSHDLKNPLSAIRMSLELAREELGEDGDDTVSSLLERSLRGATRMEAVIDDLLAFARVGTSHQLGRVDLAAVLAEVLEDLGEAVSPGRVRQQDLPTVRGDAVQLRVVLQNLVANAVKFAPWDTEVEVSAERVPEGWRVCVADRGPGVPPEHRERVFEPMVRLDKSVPGSGVGLATCRRIVEGHGGRIGLDGRVGGGAVTWFELPATA